MVQDAGGGGARKGGARPHAGEGRHARVAGADCRDAAGPDSVGVLPEHDQHEDLGLAPLGAFNMHGSLLPKYRGRAPVNWAVLHGERRIGMTLHRMVREPDAGNIVDQEGVDIGPRDTAEQAFRKVLPCARRVLSRQIDALLAGSATEMPQDESQATYFGGASLRTAASTGRDLPSRYSTWCVPSRTPIRGVHRRGRFAPDGVVGGEGFPGCPRQVWQARRGPLGLTPCRGDCRRCPGAHAHGMARRPCDVPAARPFPLGPPRAARAARSR